VVAGSTEQDSLSLTYCGTLREEGGGGMFWLAVGDETRLGQLGPTYDRHDLRIEAYSSHTSLVGRFKEGDTKTT
jgi:hypothetical protein